jgi:hypothetical protein
MKIKVEGQAQTVLLMSLRIGAPLAFLVAVLLGSLSWSNGSYGLVAINSFLAGVNAVLTWVEWRVFEV